MQELLNSERIRKAISVLKNENELFEIRVIKKAPRKMVLSGYFKDVDVLLNAFNSVDVRCSNVYISLNAVNEALYSREQRDRFVAGASTTSDHEIDSYEWLFIDIDPTRPEGVSASDEELALAKELDARIYFFLKNHGFYEPVRALSGNGVHQLYKIDLPNCEENKQLIKNVLTALSDRFSNDKVKVDIVNHNPSRIMKLYGTMAQKGANTEDRPHRMSEITSVPDVIINNNRDTLESIADMVSGSSVSATPHSVHTEFNLLDFMSKHNLRVEREGSQRDGKILFLEECPFDHSHTHGDARIMAYSNGAIAFKCQHNSCSRYTWQDVRTMFEPDAYHKDRDRSIEEGYKRHLEIREEQKVEAVEYEDAPVKRFKIRPLKTANELMKKDLPEPKIIVGVGEEVPLLVEGTCILSAKPKLGKSWLALSMCVAVARGEDFLGYKTNKCSALYLDLETSEQLQQKRIRKVCKDFDVPDNFYIETETNTLSNGLIEQLEAYIQADNNIGLIVIDVFQIVRSKATNTKESEYEHAYRDITPLNNLAQKYHLAIILVCHDRKTVDPDDPFSNILGSTGLQGAATQMMVMFRKNKNTPIHISVKGKTIDGLPELNVDMDNGSWILKSVGSEAEANQDLSEYMESDIRAAVKEVALQAGEEGWKGRCGQFINDATELRFGLACGPKEIGRFLNKFQGFFMRNDNIQVRIINNGSGPKIYELKKTDLITEDEMGWQVVKE